MWTKARCLAALHPRLPDSFGVEVLFRKPILLPATVEFGEAELDDSRAAQSGEAGSRAGGKREPKAIRFTVRGAGKGTPHLDGTVSFRAP
jgi:hypothetical protein